MRSQAHLQTSPGEKSKVTVFQSLKQVAKARKKEIDEVVNEYLRSKGYESQTPVEGLYLYEIWSELGETRREGYSGPLRITFSEIESYCRLTGIELAPWEVEILSAVDRTYVTTIRDNPRRTSNQDQKPGSGPSQGKAGQAREVRRPG